MTLRRTGFLRTRSPKTNPKQRAEESNSPEFDGIRSENPPLLKPLVRGAYGPAQLKPAPKPVEHRNEDLLRLARGKKCLLAIGTHCSGDETVVACHSNLGEHGKSMARKADDQYTVWGCFHCHQALDSGAFSADVKREWFLDAHSRQIMEWARIVYDMAQSPKDRKAAEWALKLLHPT